MPIKASNFLAHQKISNGFEALNYIFIIIDFITFDLICIFDSDNSKNCSMGLINRSKRAHFLLKAIST